MQLLHALKQAKLERPSKEAVCQAKYMKAMVVFKVTSDLPSVSRGFLMS
jgi:hypothetical protein